MKHIAVYKKGRKLFAEFKSMAELVRVLRVREEDVVECLNGHARVAFTAKTVLRKHKAFAFKEIDTSKTGNC